MHDVCIGKSEKRLNELIFVMDPYIFTDERNVRGYIFNRHS